MNSTLSEWKCIRIKSFAHRAHPFIHIASQAQICIEKLSSATTKRNVFGEKRKGQMEWMYFLSFSNDKGKRYSQLSSYKVAQNVRMMSKEEEEEEKSHSKENSFNEIKTVKTYSKRKVCCKQHRFTVKERASEKWKGNDANNNVNGFEYGMPVHLLSMYYRIVT